MKITTASDICHAVMISRPAQPALRPDVYEAFDLAADAYVVTDGAGTIREANLVAFRLLQVPPHSLCGKPLLCYLAKDSRKVFLSLLRRRYTVDHVEVGEVSLQLHNGSQVPATLTMVASQDTAGKSLSLHWLLRSTIVSPSLYVFHDQLQEPLSRDFIEKTRSLLCTHSLDGTIFFFNHAAADSLGYPLEELLGANLYSFLVPSQQAQFSKYLQQIRQEMIRDGVLQFATKRGTVCNFHYRNSFHKLAGSPLYVRIHLQELPTYGQAVKGEPLIFFHNPRTPHARADNLFAVNTALQQEIAYHQEAEKALLRTQEELERRVAARTVALTQTNALLEQEILERERVEAALRESEARYRALFENATNGTGALARTLKALTTDPALDPFLGQVLSEIAQQLRARWAQLWLYEKSQDNMSLYMSFQDGKIELSHERAALQSSPGIQELCLWSAILPTARPIVITDINQDPRLVNHSFLHQQGVQAVLLVPLLLENEVSGYLSLQTTERQSYRTEELELAQALAQQVTLAMQLARFANERRQAAVLEERNRLAREIHDTIAQGLTGIVIQLEAAQEVLFSTPAVAQSHVTRAIVLARESLAEARRSVMALHPQVLEHHDLPTAFERLAAQLEARMNIPITVQFHGTPYPLSAEVAANLLRIGQEAIVNACKHAQPHTIALDFTFRTNDVQLHVQDDGQGFDVSQPSQTQSTGFGLTSMRERAERIGGRFTIESLPKQGTHINVVVPISHFPPSETSL